MNLFNYLDRYVKENSELSYGDILEMENNPNKQSNINLRNFLNNNDFSEYEKYHKSNLSRLKRFS